MSDARPTLIDCDIHAVLPGITALMPFLPAYWREQVEQTGFKGPPERWYPNWALGGAGSGGELAGSRLEHVQRDVLDANPLLEHAILNCDCAVETLHNPDAAAAIASAANEWVAAEWLARDSRLRASVVVPSQFPELAAAEIARMAGRPGFVSVLLPVRSEAPYGSRNFRPLFAAAAAQGWPVGLHFGGLPGNPSTPVGWPSFFMEEYAGMSSVFQTQLISLIAGGVFDSFPQLKVVLIEGGVAWLPPMLWRLDKNWKGLRREIPWVRRAPSEYVAEHIRLTTAPFDSPDEAGTGLAELVAEMGSPEMLLYASDYPHRHGESAAVANLDFLPPLLAARIKSDHARAVYRF